MYSQFFDVRITSLTNDEPSTFGEIFNCYYGRLCFFSDRLIYDKNAAEHIVRETFVKLWERRTHFLISEAVKSFLYSSVRNASLDHIRNIEGKEAIPKERSYRNKAYEEAKVLNAMIKSETFTAINMEIDKIPGKRGQLERLAYLDEMTDEIIAQLIQVSKSDTEIQKARYLLAQRLKFYDNN